VPPEPREGSAREDVLHGQLEARQHVPAVQRLVQVYCLSGATGRVDFYELPVRVNDPHGRAGGQVVGHLEAHLTGRVGGGQDFDGQIGRDGAVRALGRLGLPGGGHERHIGNVAFARDLIATVRAGDQPCDVVGTQVELDR